MTILSRVFIAVLVVFLSFPAFALNDECPRRSVHGGLIFKLSIMRTFDDPVTFALCQSQKESKGRLTTYWIVKDEVEEGKESIVHQLTLDLGESGFRHVLELYEAAVLYNPTGSDRATILDGSYWCLETLRGATYLKGCFQSPDSRDKERGLVGLFALGKHLWSISEIEADRGLLY